MKRVKILLKKAKKLKEKSNQIYLIDSEKSLSDIDLSKDEVKHVKAEFKNENNSVILNRLDSYVVVEKPESKDEEYLTNEEARKYADKTAKFLNSKKQNEAQFVNLTKSTSIATAYIEGFLLSNYQFNKYFSDKDKRDYTLDTLQVIDDNLKQKDLDALHNTANAVFESRDLVNEPLSYLTAEQLSEEIKRISKKAGFKVTVFDKKKIEKLGMGGLLAVNIGSPNPPTFNIMEWKPRGAKNKKPIVLVGKGVVYDTGGLSLKPTKNSMDKMKCDMAGAAAVVGTMAAISSNKLPLHVIGLVPATENRPDGLAYAPGDVVKMYNGMTVEVLNTDAEGRMILADALAYAKDYDPELVIDLATLTGAAAIAIGSQGLVAMGNAEQNKIDTLMEAGFDTFERVAQFPFWDDYSELLKSDIADCKNVGGRDAGAITAGKFLEKFTDYPYIHLDIAGPAFIDAPDSYKSVGGTGVGVRLLNDFLTNKYLSKK